MTQRVCHCTFICGMLGLNLVDHRFNLNVLILINYFLLHSRPPSQRMVAVLIDVLESELWANYFLFELECHT